MKKTFLVSLILFATICLPYKAKGEWVALNNIDWVFPDGPGGEWSTLTPSNASQYVEYNLDPSGDDGHVGLYAVIDDFDGNYGNEIDFSLHAENILVCKYIWEHEQEGGGWKCPTSILFRVTCDADFFCNAGYDSNYGNGGGDVYSYLNYYITSSLPLYPFDGDVHRWEYLAAQGQAVAGWGGEFGWGTGHESNSELDPPSFEWTLDPEDNFWTPDNTGYHYGGGFDEYIPIDFTMHWDQADYNQFASSWNPSENPTVEADLYMTLETTSFLKKYGMARSYGTSEIDISNSVVSVSY